MTKEKIVEAAYRVWGRNFYQKTSLSQLAEELQVSKPALYRHFCNKQALTNAMLEGFFDDFAAVILPGYGRMLNNEKTEGFYEIIRSITDFFARNEYALVFSLVNVFGKEPNSKTVVRYLKSRGINLEIVYQFTTEQYSREPEILDLTFSSVVFLMSYFHKSCNSFKKEPDESEILNAISEINETVKHGLGFSASDTDSLDFTGLENIAKEGIKAVKPEPIFKAVAEAVAEAGPWEASMDMVARRMGLAKSSLYGRFKNRQEMIRLFFIAEYERASGFCQQRMKLSVSPVEQLYLGIFSFAVYLHSRPEILKTLGWIRTRKLELGKPDMDFEMAGLFDNVDIEPLRNCPDEKKRQVSHWILFLLISSLGRDVFRRNGRKPETVAQILYKFITLGVGGFTKI